MTMRAPVASIAAAAVLSLTVTGCKPFGGPLPGNPAPQPYFIQHLQGEGRFPVDVDLGDATRDVYLTFVNPDLTDARGTLYVGGSIAGGAAGSGEPAARLASSLPAPKRAPTPAAITAYNQNPFGGRGRSAPSLRLFERPPAAPMFDTPGSNIGGTFYNMDLSSVAATCRAVVGPVDVGGGESRTLNIWVADDCWDATAPGWRIYRVTSGMVLALADEFLLDGGGTFDDIYDWVTGMLGPEWGSPPFSGLIASNDEITILLCDIGNTNAPGGYVGYYWAKDNSVKGSNPAYLDYYSSERLLFTIDAVTFADGDGGGPGWNGTDPWPEEIYSTLAHEFQHMIHFYQRDVLRDAVDAGDTWINEMASQVVEDLLADKMDVIGPRGVTGTDGTGGSPGNVKGRLPLFNAYNDLSLSAWNNDLVNYSVTYAFGAWLARNYGGAELLHRLMQCTRTGPASIEDIVSQATGRPESFPRLLQRWSAAQLLSDVTDAPAGYRYNTGGFVASTANGNAYQLGSINLFNYSPVPKVYSGGGTIGTSQHLSTSAALYQAAAAGTGSLGWELRMPCGVIATVIAR